MYVTMGITFIISHKYLNIVLQAVNHRCGTFTTSQCRVEWQASHEMVEWRTG